jgi:thiamine-monophosphate kinase
MTGEFEWIERLRGRFPAIGDDCAVVELGADRLLLATDALVGGVDFTADTLLTDVGWNAVVANVSDVAAMGGHPRWLLAAVSAPDGTDLDALADGLSEGADAHGCALVGGDLSSTAGPLVVSVAVVGTVSGPPGPVRRGGARPGDDIWVTGPLGGPAAAGYAGRRHLARVEAGNEARRAGATAMIDISDGLAADLGHLARESGVGIALDTVPLASGATLEQAMHGGDEYELVYCGWVGVTGAIRIGTCTADRAQRTLAGEPFATTGHEHRF